MAVKTRPRPKRKITRTPALLDPSQQLAGKDLSHAANQIVNLQFGPQEQALKRAANQTRTQGNALVGRAGDYYRQIAADEAAGVAQRNAISDEVARRIAAAGGTANDAIGQAGAQAQQLSQGANTGSTYGSPRAAEEAAAAQGRAAAATQDASLGDAAAYGRTERVASLSKDATGLQGGETQQRLINQLASQMAAIRGKQTDLAASRGAARSKTLVDLRQQAFENLATSEGLGIKQQDLAAQIAQNDAANRLAQKRINEANQASKRTNATTRRGQNMTAAQRAADRASREAIAKERLRYGGRRAGNEPADAVKVKTGITNAQLDLGQMLQTGQIPSNMRAAIKQNAPGLLNRPMSPQLAKQVLQTLGAPAIVAQAALELAQLHGLRPGTVSKLRAMRVKIPRSWLATVAGPVQ